MELGIVADEISRDFGVASKVGVGLGLRRYEIRFLQTGRVPICDRSELREIERVVDGEGLELTALSPGLFKWTDSPSKFRTEMDSVFPAAADLAHRWNLSSVIIFGFCKAGATEANADLIPNQPLPNWVVDSLREAAVKAGEENLRLLIEPEPVCYADTTVAASDLIALAGGEHLGINYDPCNDAWTLRHDTLADFKRVGSLISNVHIKDQMVSSVGSGLPTWVVPGRGIVDWPAHLTALKRSSYSGPISLEPHINGATETIRSCRDSVIRMIRDAGLAEEL